MLSVVGNFVSVSEAAAERVTGRSVEVGVWVQRDTMVRLPTTIV